MHWNWKKYVCSVHYVAATLLVFLASYLQCRRLHVSTIPSKFSHCLADKWEYLCGWGNVTSFLPLQDQICDTIACLDKWYRCTRTWNYKAAWKVTYMELLLVWLYTPISSYQRFLVVSEGVPHCLLGSRDGSDPSEDHHCWDPLSQGDQHQEQTPGLWCKQQCMWHVDCFTGGLYSVLSWEGVKDESLFSSLSHSHPPLPPCSPTSSLLPSQTLFLILPHLRSPNLHSLVLASPSHPSLFSSSISHIPHSARCTGTSRETTSVWRWTTGWQRARRYAGRS